MLPGYTCVLYGSVPGGYYGADARGRLQYLYERVKVCVVSALALCNMDVKVSIEWLKKLLMFRQGAEQQLQKQVPTQVILTVFIQKL